MKLKNDRAKERFRGHMVKFPHIINRKARTRDVKWPSKAIHTVPAGTGAPAQVRLLLNQHSVSSGPQAFSYFKPGCGRMSNDPSRFHILLP